MRAVTYVGHCDEVGQSMYAANEVTKLFNTPAMIGAERHQFSLPRMLGRNITDKYQFRSDIPYRSRPTAVSARDWLPTSSPVGQKTVVHSCLVIRLRFGTSSKRVEMTERTLIITCSGDGKESLRGIKHSQWPAFLAQAHNAILKPSCSSTSVEIMVMTLQAFIRRTSTSPVA